MSYNPELSNSNGAELSGDATVLTLLFVIVIAAFVIYSIQATEQRNIFKDLWDGNIDLAMTYWVYGVLGGIVWGVGIFALDPAPDGNLVKILWLIFACYYLVIYVGVWKAANKFIGNKTWAILAKFAIIVVVLPIAIHFLKWLASE